MQFIRYGINLERLHLNHLEMVRQWRNSNAVRTRMHYQEKISPQQQISWFEQLSLLNNWYFVASVNQNPFGLLHVKNINWEKLVGESGAFIGDHVHVGDVETGLAILAFMDFAFLILGLDQLTAKYHPGFKKTVDLNNMLGYTVTDEESNGFVRASVTLENYLQKTSALRKSAEKMRGSATVIMDEGEWLAERTALLRSTQRQYLLEYLSQPPPL